MQLAGNRVRLQRLRDAKCISGWVLGTKRDEVQIELVDTPFLSPGERTFVEIHCQDGRLSFTGACLRCADGIATISRQGKATLSPSLEKWRRRVQDTTGLLDYDGVTYRFEVVDVSQQSLGIILEEAIPRGAEVALELECGYEVLAFRAHVLNCRPARQCPGAHRAGLELVLEGRLDRYRWARVITQKTAWKSAA